MKKTKNFKRFLSGSLCIMLIAAMAPLTIGCNDNEKESSSASVSDSVKDEVVSVGEGQTSFDFTVTHKDGSQKLFEVSTDKKTVGEALLDAELISGDDGDYGLYVKTVDGETLDYEADGYYWSFLIGGEYAQTGVDMTDIESGKSYEFKAEKG